MNALERPKIGLASILDGISRMLFKQRIDNAQLTDTVIFERVEYKNGRVTVPLLRFGEQARRCWW